MLYKERLSEQRLLRLEKIQLWGNLINMYKDLMGGNGEERGRLSSVAQLYQTSSNGHKSKTTKSSLNVRKKKYCEGSQT